MSDFFLAFGAYLFWIALGLAMSIPVGIYAWRLGCAFGGWDAKNGRSR